MFASNLVIKKLVKSTFVNVFIESVLSSGDDTDRRREGQRRGFHEALREDHQGRLGSRGHRVLEADFVSYSHYIVLGDTVLLTFIYKQDLTF